MDGIQLSGRNIRLFLVDGSPHGLITAEIMNWTGHVLFAPRAKIPELLSRPEASRTGVYLLQGTADETDETLVYIGEGDDVGVRVAQHVKGKEFWDTACLITSKDQNLTKAHVRFLESRLIRLTKQNGLARLTNATAPEGLYLPEAELSDMHQFVQQLLVLLPVLGLTFLRSALGSENESVGDTLSLSVNQPSWGPRAPTLRVRPTLSQSESPLFVMNGGAARAIEVDGQMVVLAGSEAKAMDQASLASNVRMHRQRLLENGTLVPTGEPNVVKFLQDVAFSSPSAAAQAVMGTSRNGRSDWISEATGQTYAQWQHSEIEASLKRNNLPHLDEDENEA